MMYSPHARDIFCEVYIHVHVHTVTVHVDTLCHGICTHVMGFVRMPSTLIIIMHVVMEGSMS